MVSYVYIARHGEAKRAGFMTDMDMGLTEEGKRQAEELGRQAASLGLKRVYSSPSRRAVETASIVCKTAGLPLCMDERIREYDYNSLEGKSFKHFIKQLGLPEATEEGRFLAEEAIGMHRYTDYEAYDSVVKRVGGFLKEAIKKGERALLISHGEVIRTLFAEAKKEKQNLLSRIRVENCALFKLLLKGGEEGLSIIKLHRVGPY